MPTRQLISTLWTPDIRRRLRTGRGNGPRLPAAQKTRMLTHLARPADAEATSDEVAAWLETLPAHDPVATARLLVEKLIVLNRAPGPARARLPALDLLSERAHRVWPLLASELEGATQPLAPHGREIAHLLEKVLKELGAGYRAAVIETSRLWLAIGLKRQMHAPIVAAIELLTARLALCDRLHARAPRGAWLELHRLYRIARELGLHERGLDLLSPAPETLYVRALLLAFAEPARLTPHEYQQLDRYVAEFGRLASIGPPRRRGDDRCAFVIDPHLDEPGIALAKRGPLRLAADHYCLLTRRLVEQVHVHIARLRSGATPESLGLPAEATSSSYLALLARAGRAWHADRRRRGLRRAFRPRVMVFVGLRAAWDALAGVNVSDASDWTIINESADGFALQLARATSEPIQVGEAALVYSPERAAAYLCLVRRVRSNNPQHLEVALQQVLPVAHPARMLPKIAGEAPEPVFYCSAIEALDRHARVIVTARRVTVRSALTLERGGTRIALHARRFVERGNLFDIVEVEAA
jgi:hypothetical protein